MSVHPGVGTGHLLAFGSFYPVVTVRTDTWLVRRVWLLKYSMWPVDRMVPFLDPLQHVQRYPNIAPMIVSISVPDVLQLLDKFYCQV